MTESAIIPQQSVTISAILSKAQAGQRSIADYDNSDPLPNFPLLRASSPSPRCLCWAIFKRDTLFSQLIADFVCQCPLLVSTELRSDADQQLDKGFLARRVVFQIIRPLAPVGCRIPHRGCSLRCLWQRRSPQLIEIKDGSSRIDRFVTSAPDGNLTDSHHLALAVFQVYDASRVFIYAQDGGRVREGLFQESHPRLTDDLNSLTDVVKNASASSECR